jgi:hypothetical protein
VVTYGERMAGGILLRAEGVARCYGKDFANGTLTAFLGCQRLWVAYRTLEEAERAMDELAARMGAEPARAAEIAREWHRDA